MTSRVDRALRYALPFLLLIFAADVLDGIVRGPQWMWNEVRLARGFCAAYGYSLYPGEHAFEPIIGTMHAPFGYLVYAFLAVLKDPVWAMMAGCALSALLYFTPIYWIHRRGAVADRLGGAYGFLACAAVVLASPGTSYSSLSIHVDAAASAAAILAAGILATARAPLGSRMLACSAALSVLSVASKQTMAPVPVALAGFLLFSEGPRRFLRYLALQAVSGVLIAAVALVMFRPPRALLFNTFTLAVHLHDPVHAGRLMEGLSLERITLAVLMPILGILLASMLFVDTGGVRSRLAANRWLVFLFAAVLQVPFALRGWTTAGGDTNHLGVVTLFVALAATTGLVMTPSIPVLMQRGLLMGIVVATLVLPWNLFQNFAQLSDIPAETAFRYEKRQPGHVYFPMNPLAVLLADGTLRHFDISVDDRGRAGYPITPAQFASGLPPHYLLIAWPPTYDPPRSALLNRLLGSMQPVNEPGLEGWHVFGFVPGRN